MGKMIFFDFLNEMKEIVGSKIPAEVRKEIEELVEIANRMRKRIEANGMIPMTEILRYNELCYKCFREVQDIPPDICGVYPDSGSDEPRETTE